MNTLDIISDIGILITSVCSVVISFLLYRKTSNGYKLEEKSRVELKELQEESNKIQIDYNKKSVQPVVFIACQQIGNSIRVEIKNFGLGAMIIKNIVVKNRNSNNQEYNALYRIFPDKIKIYSYAVDTKGRPIGVNGYIILIDFRNLSSEEIKLVRDILGMYTIKIEYKDIYGNAYEEEKNFYDIFCVEYRYQ